MTKCYIADNSRLTVWRRICYSMSQSREMVCNVYRPATRRGEGCQVDLLIRTERTLMVVEIKRKKEIRHEIIDDVAEKIRKLKYDKRLSVRTALVYGGHLSASIPADRYFDFIVPAESLLSGKM